MIFYNNISELKNRINNNKKALRIIEAIESSSIVEENVYYSLGDCLVFMITGDNFEDKEFKAQEMYMDIIYVCDGNLEIKYSNRDKLELIKPYDRIEDTCYYKGSGKKIKLNKGNIILLKREEAYLIFKDNAKKIFIKFTNENDVF